MADIKMILIGGSSHAGKSTLARALAARLGWDHATTDRLARHPGRPWASAEFTPPPHVLAHYRDLDGEALIASVMEHYTDRIWPMVETLAAERLAPDGAPLVLEGSALLPAKVAGLGEPAVAAVWLTAEADLFRRRMHAESRYDEAGPDGRRLIDAFLDRALRFDRLMMDEVRRLHLPYLVVEEGASVDDLV
ncbi:MAG: hypothetical protein JSR86_21055, partial [Proteobacteria bacterium]|nr:hypothetical protein [Pseudomonadota bacterium]